jgi:hypothetical protein
MTFKRPSCSIAYPDLGSGIQCFFYSGTRIRDGKNQTEIGEKKNVPNHNSHSLVKKFLSIKCCRSGSGFRCLFDIQDPGSGMEKS